VPVEVVPVDVVPVDVVPVDVVPVLVVPVEVVPVEVVPELVVPVLVVPVDVVPELVEPVDVVPELVVPVDVVPVDVVPVEVVPVDVVTGTSPCSTTKGIHGAVADTLLTVELEKNAAVVRRVSPSGKVDISTTTPMALLDTGRATSTTNASPSLFAGTDSPLAVVTAGPSDIV